MLAHDRLAFREALPSDEDEQEVDAAESQEQQQEPQQVTDEFSLVEDDNVKIVRIDKATEPLGATVKNENGTVLIGRIVKGGAADKCGKKNVPNLFCMDFERYIDDDDVVVVVVRSPRYSVQTTPPSYKFSNHETEDRFLGQ